MDVVERLRVIAQGMGRLGSIEREAADEIERLRDFLRMISILDNTSLPTVEALDQAITLARAALGEGK